MTQLIRWFRDTGLQDVPLVGGKNASLGELCRELVPKGVRVPDGFAITADGYRYFVRSAGLAPVIEGALAGLDVRDVEDLRRRGREVRHAMLAASLPPELEQAITAAYDLLGAGSAEPIDVAVRSSATAEDLPDASFAGQQETYLNVQGDAALLESVPALLRVAVHRPRDLLPRSTRGSTTSRSRCRSACSGWCAPTWPPRA